ncbi:MAG: FliM/FliN family flagellar motor switch protein [Enterocloster bolteae]
MRESRPRQKSRAEAEKQDGEVREEPQQAQTPSMQEARASTGTGDAAGASAADAGSARAADTGSAHAGGAAGTHAGDAAGAHAGDAAGAHTGDAAGAPTADTGNAKSADASRAPTDAQPGPASNAPGHGPACDIPVRPGPGHASASEPDAAVPGPDDGFMKDSEGQEKQQPPRDNILIHPVGLPADGDSGVEEGTEERGQPGNASDRSAGILLWKWKNGTETGVKDILELTQGSLVVLDKMAGEQADLVRKRSVWSQSGDIVVVEDNFGIRITEIAAR